MFLQASFEAFFAKKCFDFESPSENYPRGTKWLSVATLYIPTQVGKTANTLDEVNQNVIVLQKAAFTLTTENWHMHYMQNALPE